MVNIPICEFCQHRLEDVGDDFESALPACQAYPEGIPARIYDSSVLHTEALHDDQGFQFLAVEGQEAFAGQMIASYIQVGAGEGLIDDLTPWGQADEGEL